MQNNLDIDYAKLKNEQRLIFDVELKPRQGDRFQPTGFPNIGAAQYETPSGVKMILVESPQSMANRLEETVLGQDKISLMGELTGLSYVKVKLNKKDSEDSDFGYTSSLVEPHRLNSPYIRDGKFKDSSKKFEDMLKSELNFEKGKMVDWKKFAKVIFKYDINSLIHGLFLSNYKDSGRLRAPRILSSFIEAENVKEVLFGGVKMSSLDASGGIVSANKEKDDKESEEKDGKKESEKANVYTNVPYTRIEYTAQRIRSYFNIDMALLRGYGLDESEEELLFFLCIFKIKRFLTSSLRLRTACDLVVDNKYPQEIRVRIDTDFVSDEKRILDHIKMLIGKCKDQGSMAENPETLLLCDVKESAKNKDKKKNGDSQEEIDTESE